MSNRSPHCNGQFLPGSPPHWDQLFITTAREGLSDDALAEQPLAGGLFRVEPDVRGGSIYVFDE